MCSGLDSMDGKFVRNEGWLAGKPPTTSYFPVVIMPIDPQGSPANCQPPPSLLGVGAEVAEPGNGPLAACHLC